MQGFCARLAELEKNLVELSFIGVDNKLATFGELKNVCITIPPNYNSKSSEIPGPFSCALLAYLQITGLIRLQPHVCSLALIYACFNSPCYNGVSDLSESIENAKDRLKDAFTLKPSFNSIDEINAFKPTKFIDFLTKLTDKNRWEGKVSLIMQENSLKELKLKVADIFKDTYYRPFLKNLIFWSEQGVLRKALHDFCAVFIGIINKSSEDVKNYLRDPKRFTHVFIGDINFSKLDLLKTDLSLWSPYIGYNLILLDYLCFSTPSSQVDTRYDFYKKYYKNIFSYFGLDLVDQYINIKRYPEFLKKDLPILLESPCTDESWMKITSFIKRGHLNVNVNILGKYQWLTRSFAIYARLISNEFFSDLSSENNLYLSYIFAKIDIMKRKEKGWVRGRISDHIAYFQLDYEEREYLDTIADRVRYVCDSSNEEAQKRKPLSARLSLFGLW